MTVETLGDLSESPEFVKRNAEQSSPITAEAEVSMMTEASDLYVSALESPDKTGNVQNMQELQTAIKNLESSKQKLTADLHTAEAQQRRATLHKRYPRLSKEVLDAVFDSQE